MAIFKRRNGFRADVDSRQDLFQATDFKRIDENYQDRKIEVGPTKDGLSKPKFQHRGKHLNFSKPMPHPRISRPNQWKVPLMKSDDWISLISKWVPSN